MLSNIYRIDLNKYTKVITDNCIAYDNITFARDICRREKVKYMIKNEALYILNPYDRKYILVCFSVCNLTLEYLEKIINQFCNMWYY